VLDFLETCPDETPLEESLALRKQHHRKNIIKAGQFQRQRRKRNVETMIMQGIRIPHCDPQDDMQKIAMIDTVSLAIYGKIL
jgi:mannitol/fructose-specific phosphotransferase system IIA component (Ntr-type)